MIINGYLCTCILPMICTCIFVMTLQRQFPNNGQIKGGGGGGGVVERKGIDFKGFRS